MRHHALRPALLSLVLVWGCGTPATSPASDPGSASTAGGDADGAAAEPTAKAPSIPDDLTGEWAQYWAPQGDADSPRYLLLADGRFGWRAAREGDAAEPQQMSGTWKRDGEVLSLAVTRRKLADGSVETPQGQALSIQLGPCPDNAEARAVDPHYACISLDGQAHFRCPTTEPEQAAFFE